ncbi:MAG: aminotransferase class III-fold pyridoxal phosphate-dependent enzyme [Lachnospiraceae bacterium]|nr:aminotransferase class III-fold pyridoxal phosphate-dependent enzyme [Lachnospiraceae bacterium]
MTGEEIKTQAPQYILQSWSKQKGLSPIPVEKAEGIYFYDYEGNRYTDMSSQLVNLNVGFGNTDIADAIKEQVDKFCFVGPSYANEARTTLAKMIIDFMVLPLVQVT